MGGEEEEVEGGLEKEGRGGRGRPTNGFGEGESCGLLRESREVVGGEVGGDSESPVDVDACSDVRSATRREKGHQPCSSVRDWPKIDPDSPRILSSTVPTSSFSISGISIS